MRVRLSRRVGGIVLSKHTQTWHGFPPSNEKNAGHAGAADAWYRSSLSGALVGSLCVALIACAERGKEWGAMASECVWPIVWSEQRDY